MSTERIIQKDTLDIAKTVLVLSFFWYFLLKGVMKENGSRSYHLALTFFSLFFMVLCIPLNLSFTYV